jgi:hypothetical protein
MLRRLICEPLVHFAVLGGALFAASSYLSPEESDDAAIIVSADRMASLAARFQGTWQRPPTEAELQMLVEAYVREEVLYREGLALGLDRDDQVIRNRVKQKMEILGEDATATEPTDADLQKYLDDHREVFEIPAPASFEQVFFNPEQRGAGLDPDMRRALEALRASRPAEGDRTLLPGRMARALPRDITAAFGPEFEQAIRTVPVGQWSDPVRSSFGMHLVRVTWRGVPTVPSLADAREVVRREWTRAQTAEARERLYRSLRARYTVTIEPLPSSAPSGGRTP